MKTDQIYKSIFELQKYAVEPEKTGISAYEDESFVPVRWHWKKDGTLFPVEISTIGLMRNMRPAITVAIRDSTDLMMTARCHPGIAAVQSGWLTADR